MVLEKLNSLVTFAGPAIEKHSDGVVETYKQEEISSYVPVIESNVENGCALLVNGQPLKIGHIDQAMEISYVAVVIVMDCENMLFF